MLKLQFLLHRRQWYPFQRPVIAVLRNDCSENQVSHYYMYRRNSFSHLKLVMQVVHIIVTVF